MSQLKLTRPLAFFDIESTGLNRQKDRIIDLAIVKILPEGMRVTHTFRVNPGMPIPPNSTEVHGIRDEDVKDCPPFAAVAREVAACLDNCDLAGFNVLRYDIPLIEEEFRRAAVPFSMEGRKVVDVQRIFHTREPRDLSAALQFYCGAVHENAHGAMPDVEATIRVLEGQFEKYGDLPETVEALDLVCNPVNPEWVDRTGKFAWDADGDAVINFGQCQGRKLREAAAKDPKFLEWMLRKDFPHDVHEIVRAALAGQMPARRTDDA